MCGWGKTPALPTASTATAVWSPGTLQHSVAILVQDIFAVEHRSTASHDGRSQATNGDREEGHEVDQGREKHFGDGYEADNIGLCQGLEDHHQDREEGHEADQGREEHHQDQEKGHEVDQGGEEHHQDREEGHEVDQGGEEDRQGQEGQKVAESEKGIEVSEKAFAESEKETAVSEQEHEFAESEHEFAESEKETAV